MKIKRLDTEVKVNGHDYVLHLRTKNFACYRQFTKEGKLVAFELFKIKTRKEEEIGGVTYPTRETYPSTTDFGNTAWSLRWNTKNEEIQERLNNLQQEYDEELRSTKE